MKAKELRTKSKTALREELTALTREQFNLRMQKGSGQLINSARMKAVRRDIARINTVLNEMRGANE